MSPILQSRTACIAAAALLATLAACGGGGDSSAPAAAPATGAQAARDDSRAAVLQGSDLAAVTARGRAGTLDTGFGVAGRAIVPVGPTDDHAEAMAVQADGRVVVAGWGNGAKGYAFELLRLTRDGAPDKTFGKGGKVVAAIGHGADVVHAIALQADGKILVAGSVDESLKGKSFAIARFNVNGSLDTSFGTRGQVVTSFGSRSDEAFAIVVQPDGRIVAAGHTADPVSGVNFALARYNADGSPDASFGNGGQVVTASRAGNGRDSIYALALQPRGGETCIVAVGGEGDFVVRRYHADGSDDGAFDATQPQDGPFESVIGAARAVTVDAQGRLVVAGHIGHDFALLRLLPDGQPDAAFGDGLGRVITPVSPTNWDEAQAVAVQGDGKLLLGGWAYAGGGAAGDFALVRYTETGALDTGFGTGGVTITPVAPDGHDDEARAMALQSDPRVPTVRVLLGGSANGSDQDFAVTRYWL
jgi:uncharacterized delta-60 repeat protein